MAGQADTESSESELVAEIEALRRRIGELEVVERRYRALAKDAPLMFVVTTDSDGQPIIQDCNEYFLATLGYRRQDVVGRPLHELYTDRSRGELYDAGGYQQALQGRFVIAERQLVAADGRIIETLLNAIPDVGADGRVHGTQAMFIDISSRKEIEVELQRRLDLERLVTSISSRFVNLTAESLDYEIAETLAATGRFLDADRGQLFVFDHAGELERVSHEWCRDGFAPRLEELQSIETSPYPWFYRRLRAGDIVAVPTLDGLPPEAEKEQATWRREGLRSLIAVPVVSGAQLSGYLAFTALSRARDWNPDNVVIMRLVGELIGSSFERLSRERLVREKEAAELASQAKSLFLATMSHEIRTPMNAVLGMVDLILDSELGRESRRHAEILKASAEGLLQLLDDILDFSKIEAGKMEIDAIDFDLRGVVESSVATLRPSAAAQGLRLDVKLGEDLPGRISGDPARLRQILLNLLGNAVKFTTDGFVELRAGLDLSGAGDPVLRFAVRDTGVGIPPSLRSRLFKPFTQVDGSTSRRFGGTGLGLAISQRLVELMGGEIGVEDAPDRGVVFWFTLPFAPAGADSEISSTPSARRRYRPESFRFLLVEDNPVNKLVASRQLEAMGYRVDAVDNGIQALDALEEETYDLVLMDCQMPVLDGYETTRRLREREGDGRRVPVIALTAHAMKGDREKCLASGMNDYISKPFRRDELLGVLERWLSTSS